MAEKIESGQLCNRHLGATVTVETESIRITGEIRGIDHDWDRFKNVRRVKISLNTEAGLMWPVVKPLHLVEVFDD